MREWSKFSKCLQQSLWVFERTSLVIYFRFLFYWQQMHEKTEPKLNQVSCESKAEFVFFSAIKLKMKRYICDVFLEISVSVGTTDRKSQNICFFCGTCWQKEKQDITSFVLWDFLYLPCMSIIPGEELFSGVVNSEPYFSSLPFFLFLFFYNKRREEVMFKNTMAPFKCNQHSQSVFI